MLFLLGSFSSFTILSQAPTERKIQPAKAEPGGGKSPWKTRNSCSRGKEAQDGEGNDGEGSAQSRSSWNEEFSQVFSVPAPPAFFFFSFFHWDFSSHQTAPDPTNLSRVGRNLNPTQNPGALQLWGFQKNVFMKCSMRNEREF